MNYRNFQYTILCEDSHHFHFIRGWLCEKGANDRRITSFGNFPHDGSGKDFVIKNFNEALKSHKSKPQNSILIIFIDADNLSFEELMSNFQDHEDKNIFFVIAKWSIETWFCYLEDKAIDETQSFKSQYRKCVKPTLLGKQLAKKLMLDTSSMPPSLHSTYTTIKDKKTRLGLS